MGEVLEPEVTEFAEGEPVAEIRPREHRRRLRQQHLPAVRRGRDPGGAVDVDPHIVGACLGARGRSFSGVHPHAHTDRGAMREGRRTESALRRRRPTDRLRGDGEHHEERVALDADLDAVLERITEQARMHRKDLVKSLRAQLVQELRRAFDVREEKREGARREPSPLAHSTCIVPHRLLAKSPGTA